jgi:hypothetical protein
MWQIFGRISYIVSNTPIPYKAYQKDNLFNSQDLGGECVIQLWYKMKNLRIDQKAN